MLAGENKLKKKEDFDRVKAQGTIVQGTSMALVIASGEPDAPTRFGFVVSTKVHKNASVRNRAKRALDEGVRQQSYHLKKGFDCVILAKPIIVKTYTTDIMKEIGVLLEKAKLVNTS